MKQTEPSEIEKVNPFSLVRPAARTERLELTDELSPGTTLIVTLKSLDAAEALAAFELVEHYAELYVGKPPSEGQPGVPPKQAFPAIGGEPVVISRQLINTACSIWMMQVEKLYSVEDLIAFTIVMPNAFMELNTAAGRLQNVTSKN